MYTVKMMIEVDYNEFITKVYDIYDDIDQACDIANELRCQGFTTFVE